MLAQERRGSNDNIKTIDTSFHSDTSIVHVAANVRKNLGLETELADGLAVLSRLLGSCRACDFQIVNTKVIEGPGNLNLLVEVEITVGELFALSEG